MTKKNNDEDSLLFRKTVGLVNTIKNDKITTAEPNKPKPYPLKPKLETNFAQAEAGTRLPMAKAEDVLAFLLPSLPKKILLRLQQGGYKPEAELDLHGMSSAAAKRELLDFLAECVKSGCHCVHIIHGKGLRSDENYPILKNNLNLWLRQHHHVMGFCSAAASDGGTGAVYVLLG